MSEVFKDKTRYGLAIISALVLLFVFCLQITNIVSFQKWAICVNEQFKFYSIATYVLIHGGLLHLASNFFPLILCLVLLQNVYPKICFYTLAGIWILSGVGIYIFAHQGCHGGASGVVYGLIFFLITAGFVSRDKRSAYTSLLLLFVFSGVLLGVMPQEDTSISWEGHLSGAIAGVLLAIILVKRIKKNHKKIDDEDDEGFKISDYIEIPE
ncbi:MAG: rhomboid family intramembrane serine protease [Bacteroidota bacterium]|nr:rhomboid family intramembrane serine protease [Bacteroidota bacterium]